MQRFSFLAILALSLVFTGSALAGHGHAKCNEDTQECLNRLSAKIKAKGWLGVELDKNDGGGYVVTSVVADSPAEAAGFQAGDVVVALNGVVLAEENKEAIHKIKKSLGPGQTASYTVKRHGAKQQLAVALGDVPATVMAEWIGQHMVEHHVQAVVASK